MGLGFRSHVEIRGGEPGGRWFFRGASVAYLIDDLRGVHGEWSVG